MTSTKPASSSRCSTASCGRPDPGPGPDQEPAVSRRVRHVEGERQPQTRDRRWPQTAAHQVCPVFRHPAAAPAVQGSTASRSPTGRPDQSNSSKQVNSFVLSCTRSGVTVRSAPVPLPADGRPRSRRGASPAVLAVHHEGFGPGRIDRAGLPDHRDRRYSAPGGWSLRSVRSTHRQRSRRGLRAERARPTGRFAPTVRSRRRSAPRSAPPNRRSAAHSRATPAAPTPRVVRSLQPQARRPDQRVPLAGNLTRQMPANWRHIEAPGGAGELSGHRHQLELRCVRTRTTARRHTAATCTLT